MTPLARASITPSRSISSATASTPADPVNEASGAPEPGPAAGPTASQLRETATSV